MPAGPSGGLWLGPLGGGRAVAGPNPQAPLDRLRARVGLGLDQSPLPPRLVQGRGRGGTARAAVIAAGPTGTGKEVAAVVAPKVGDGQTATPLAPLAPPPPVLVVSLVRAQAGHPRPVPDPCPRPSPSRHAPVTPMLEAAAAILTVTADVTARPGSSVGLPSRSPQGACEGCSAGPSTWHRQ